MPYYDIECSMSKKHIAHVLYLMQHEKMLVWDGCIMDWGFKVEHRKELMLRVEIPKLGRIGVIRKSLPPRFHLVPAAVVVGQ